jgi:hypothetical protein
MKKQLDEILKLLDPNLKASYADPYEDEDIDGPGYISVSNGSFPILSFAFNTYPACCGIVILKNVTVSDRLFAKEAFKAALDRFKEECTIPLAKSKLVYGPYGMIMVSLTNERYIDLFKAQGFEQVAGFTNPKTDNEIYTLVYYV